MKAGGPLVPFPFSDMSQSKLRPAVVLADGGRGDWILCQVTGNPYADARAIELRSADLQTGSLLRTSYARPGKLFTANQNLFVSEVGILGAASLNRILDAVIRVIRP